MIPLYAFVQGDTLGLLVLAEETETIESLAKKAQAAASVRVAPRPDPRVIYGGTAIDPRLTVALVGLKPLSRFDVRFARDAR